MRYIREYNKAAKPLKGKYDDPTRRYQPQETQGEIRLLNHLVRAEQQLRWNHKIEPLGSLAVEEKIRSCRLLYREVTGPRSLENSVDVGRGATILVVQGRTV